MTPPTSSGFGTTMRTSRKSYSRKTLTHVSPGSMISSSTSDSDNSLHSLYFTSYHGLINYPQKILALAGAALALKSPGCAPGSQPSRSWRRSGRGRSMPGARHMVRCRYAPGLWTVASAGSVAGQEVLHQRIIHVESGGSELRQSGGEIKEAS